MSWSANEYPRAMNDLDDKIRNKAIEIVDALLNAGFSEERAIPIAISKAQEWVEDEAEGYVQFVVKHADGWAVRRSDSSQASLIFESKAAAIEKGRELAKKQGVALEIYDVDNNMVERHSYSETS